VLKTRVWTAAVALPTVLAVVIFAPNRFFTLFVAALGGWELYEVATFTSARSAASIAAVVLAGGGSMLALIAGGGASWTVPAMMTLVMLALVAMVAVAGGAAAPKGFPLTLIGSAYVGLLFPYFALLRNLDGGIAAFIFMLLVVVASDTGAYFAGRSLGRHKLAPKVSPQKTMEGAVGGFVASLAAGWILRMALEPGWTPAAAIGAAAAIGVLAQFGDLAGSALKRSAGVKDSGWIFPGHGGLLDRSCSLVFACVFTYYYCK